MWRPDPADSGLVFPNPVGAFTDANNPCPRHFKPLLWEAGLPPIRFHDLRHTCATLLLAKGVHPKVVSEMLGHANIGITLDTYSHVMPGMGSAAAGAMDAALENRPGEGPNLVPLEDPEAPLNNDDEAMER